ncbi:transcriptional regulator GlxA family with amidase domain [Catenulispora sp. GP43]|uniref:helix-turn-helix domain-containing protein n=1 Tax=Catenulispora sp. GP43 TaxID=3156263 RepID=UPI0035156BA7
MDYTVLDESLIDEVAQGTPGGPDRQIRFTGYGPATAIDTDLWLRTSAYVDDVAASAGDQPLVTHAAARLLAATALSVFPNTASVEPGSADRRDAHPRMLRRAMAFLQEHASEDISAADIAAAAGTSIRAVQLAFHHHLNTTPTAYLRRIRLQHAHDDLRAANPETTTVTQIAASWGFWNPGRFAAYYRSAFGSLPADTLHNR